jgi:hypothetical protein
MRRPIVIAVLVAGLLAPVAGAALVPVPLVVQHSIKQRTAALAYVPARVPFGFRYARWSYTAGARPATGWLHTGVRRTRRECVRGAKPIGGRTPGRGS